MAESIKNVISGYKNATFSVFTPAGLIASAVIILIFVILSLIDFTLTVPITGLSIPLAFFNPVFLIISLIPNFKVSEKDPLQFINTSGLWKWQFSEVFKKVLVEKRFDLVASSVQDLFEEVMVEWIRNAIKATGVGDLALSGGGFMNVKLNYLVSKLPEVDSLFVFPSCGDESNPVGAAILAALKIGFSPENIKPLGMIYWGPSYSNEMTNTILDLL